ncbi:MAG: hypothetical protein LBQ68_05125 [Clostridiales bacterium]|nr:hypothetical protein [Clostridiales bacterium]
MLFGYHWLVKGCGLKTVKIPPGYTTYGDIQHTKRPFFNIMTENTTVKLFLDALAYDPENASCFISKNCIKRIDLSELKETFGNGGFKYLPQSTVVKNGKTNIILLMNSKDKTILHLYMVREPDRFGQWKIFNVEKE